MLTIKNLWPGLLLVIFASIFLQISTVLLPFGYNDDYHALFDSMTGEFSAKNHVLTRDGRFLTAVLVEQLFGTLSNVNALRYARAIGLLFTSLGAGAYFVMLRSAGFKNFFSTSLAVATFSTPAFCVYNSWAICFPYSIGAFFALLSGILVYFGIVDSHRSWVQRMILIITGVFVSTLCYWIYQPIAFFSLLSSTVLYWKSIQHRKIDLIRLFALLGAFALSGVLYFGLNNLLIQFFDLPSSGRVELASNSLERISYIYNHTIPAAAGGWFALWGQSIAMGVSLVILTVILCAFILSGIKDFLIKSTLALFITVSSIITFSVLSEAYIAYRLYAGCSAWILFLLWASVPVLMSKVQSLKIPVVYSGIKISIWVFLIWGGLSCALIPYTYLHSLNSKEYTAIKEAISTDLTSFPNNLSVVLPAPYERSMKEVFWAEYKTRSSHMPWVAPKMFSLALSEVFFGSLAKDHIRESPKPINLFYAAGNEVTSNRPVIDVFSRVHADKWSWVIHPLVGNCKKINNLEFIHSPEFGVFDNTEFPYIYHLGLGWIYIKDPANSVVELLEHRGIECVLSAERFPVIEPTNEPPLLYDPFIGYRARLIQPTQ